MHVALLGLLAYWCKVISTYTYEIQYLIKRLLSLYINIRYLSIAIYMHVELFISIPSS
jgi:hypothetical protein